MERSAVQDAQTPEGLKSSQAVLEDRQLPLEQKKRKILRNLRTLEQAGLLTASNKYQDLVNDISKVDGAQVHLQCSACTFCVTLFLRHILSLYVVGERRMTASKQYLYLFFYSQYKTSYVPVNIKCQLWSVAQKNLYLELISKTDDESMF